ncbi:ABC transporter ATP-binding protein [Neobacillus mesonae]|uniref:ABC transporter ATP-binding protein n=1 Tax=Neobacillus mesonae TaxID=1193713 RepID=A0A3T0HSW0_9BACI|nr:ABC transporter ATP-binding protein [Neobacillus mesonae]AZU60131.1 ABC transporter ATP-binding protein [Neobacillus mesonae]
MTSFINVKNISKSFKDQKVLKKISFSVEEGSITGLLGPNGSGKTTMIRLLNGVILPTDGEIVVGGFDPNKNGDEIRKISGIVTESTSLYHEMSAYDNLMFFSELYGVKDDSRIDYLLEQFEMTEHKDKLVGTFSTGMKKRVALAKALLHRPKILFLDEPTNGLDPEGIQMVIGYLKKINKDENITILICTHVLHQLETICDHYLFIQNGMLLESGNRRELEEKYLGEIDLVVETNLIPSGEVYHNFPYKRIDESHLSFRLNSKKDVPSLLRLILKESDVFSSAFANRDLETLYFAIRGEQNE